MPVTDGDPIDVPYEVKRRERLAAKRAIANYAATLVNGGGSLVIDSGSTTFALAQAIRARSDLTVATNDLRIAHYLAEGGGVRLMVTGGQLIDTVFTLVGPVLSPTWRASRLTGRSSGRTPSTLKPALPMSTQSRFLSSRR